MSLYNRPTYIELLFQNFNTISKFACNCTATAYIPNTLLGVIIMKSSKFQSYRNVRLDQTACNIFCWEMFVEGFVVGHHSTCQTIQHVYSLHGYVKEAIQQRVLCRVLFYTQIKPLDKAPSEHSVNILEIYVLHFIMKSTILLIIIVGKIYHNIELMRS